MENIQKNLNKAFEMIYQSSEKEFYIDESRLKLKQDKTPKQEPWMIEEIYFGKENN